MTKSGKRSCHVTEAPINEILVSFASPHCLFPPLNAECQVSSVSLRREPSPELSHDGKWMSDMLLSHSRGRHACFLWATQPALACYSSTVDLQLAEKPFIIRHERFFFLRVHSPFTKMLSLVNTDCRQGVNTRNNGRLWLQLHICSLKPVRNCEEPRAKHLDYRC